MYKIIRKEVLSGVSKLMEVEAPQVAGKARPGQFVVLRNDETGERFPLTIADFDREARTITLIFQEVGKSTLQLGKMGVGDSIATLTGPLGVPTEIENFGTVVCVGGGIGIAPLFPITRALKQAGNEVLTIIGARTKELIFWEERMREVSSELIVCTDDGTHGRKALVTEPLKELLDCRKDIRHIWAIGPAIMMRFVAAVTQPYNVPTIVSLNTVMVDGTGMCGSCRVLIDGEAKFVCVDGPEFDGHKVNWDLMLSRLSYYKNEEKISLDIWQNKCQGHTCSCPK